MNRELGSDTTTLGIRIQAEPRFLPDESAPEEKKYIFAYRVRITNNSDRVVQLLSRHWIIVNGAGVRRDVEGEGVIGQQPTLRTGETFEYTSWAPISTEWGTMEGTFKMRDELGQIFTAHITRFYLASRAEVRTAVEA